MRWENGYNLNNKCLLFQAEVHSHWLSPSRPQLDNSSLSSMRKEWTWTDGQNFAASLFGVRKPCKNISATVITKMQRWLNLSWMSSFPLRSALFLSPAGRNSPTLLRTSTKYDPLPRKLVSARSDHHLWVQLHFLHHLTYSLLAVSGCAVVCKVAGKVVF